MKNFKRRIYTEAQIKIEDAYDKSKFLKLTEKEIEIACFEMGAIFVLEMFSQLPREKYKRGITESQEDYIKRLESDIVELQCSNAGWMTSFKA